jgi:hypothetical protein
MLVLRTDSGKFQSCSYLGLSFCIYLYIATFLYKNFMPEKERISKMSEPISIHNIIV